MICPSQKSNINPVMTYKIQTTGRVSGAIGITYPFEEEVDVVEIEGKPNWEEIRLALYEGRTKSKTKWECVGGLKIFRVVVSTKKI